MFFEAIPISRHLIVKRITKAFALLLWSAVALTAQLNSVKAQTSPSKQEKLLPFTIARDTTFITEPLTEKGLVDYLEAVNQRNSNGVTPENNSSVLMLKAMGPRIWPKDMPEVSRNEYLRRLGIDAVPNMENCFVDLEDYVTDQKEQHPAIDSKKVVDEHWMAMEQPWTRESRPLLADWLDSNESAMQLIIEASKQTKRFDPIVSEDESKSFTGFYVMPEPYRIAARALAIRTMFRIGSAEFDGACDDILAIFRLARLVNSTNAHGLPEYLCGHAIEGIGNTCCLSLLQTEGVTREQLDHLCDGLKRLPDSVSLSQVVDQRERIMALRVVQMIAADVADGKKERLDNSLPEALRRLISADETPAFDWDRTLRKMNTRYDEFIDALHLGSYLERGTKLGALWQQFEKDLESRDSYGKLTLLTADQGIRNVEADSVELCLMNIFYPAIFQVEAARARCSANTKMTMLATRIEKCFLDRGKYPQTLDELEPEFASELLLDPFIDQPFHYGIEPDGFFLYSVGANCRDDGGKHFRTSSGQGDPNKNDVVLRITKARLSHSPPAR